MSSRNDPETFRAADRLVQDTTHPKYHPNAINWFKALCVAGCLSACGGSAPLDNGSRPRRIEVALNDASNPELAKWLDSVRGSVGRRGGGSKTVWSRKNDYGLGLYVSAVHVYGLSGFSSRRAEVFDVVHGQAGIFESSQLPLVDGSPERDTSLVADFPLLHPDIADNSTNTTIDPGEDFFLGVIDSQRTNQTRLAQYPEPPRTTQPLEMYEPSNRTTASPTWAAPNPGERVIAVGYPQDTSEFPNGAFVSGRLLTDDDAHRVQEALRLAGDAEGLIPYNSETEFFMDAQGLPGMSGGGVFNDKSELVGIMVRASDNKAAPKIVRATRISHIRRELGTIFDRLSLEGREAVRPFVAGELP